MSDFRGKRNQAVDWLVDKLAKLISLVVFLALVALWSKPETRRYGSALAGLVVVFFFTAGWSIVTSKRLANNDLGERIAFYAAFLIFGGLGAVVFGSMAIDALMRWWQAWWPPWG